MSPLHPALIAAASQHVAKLAQGALMPMATTTTSPMRSSMPSVTSAPRAPVSPGHQVASGTPTPATSSPAIQSSPVSPPMGTPPGRNKVLSAGPTPAPMPLPVLR